MAAVEGLSCGRREKRRVEGEEGGWRAGVEGAWEAREGRVGGG